MNDRYLYRAKRINNGEWVEGHLICSFTGIHYIVKSFDHILNQLEIYEVDRSTICQCTGLKDKNGKLIWENDIVKDESGAIGVVRYGKYDYHIGFYIDWINEKGLSYRKELGYWAPKVEVIGNIFDNPELLEVGE